MLDTANLSDYELGRSTNVVSKLSTFSCLPTTHLVLSTFSDSSQVPTCVRPLVLGILEPRVR